MTAPQCILLVDDDRAVTDALALALESPGRTIIICSDVESAEICLTRFPVTHLVSDVQFSGDFGFEGLHSLSRVRSLAPQCKIVLITGYATDALCKAAIGLGAAEVLSKPFDMTELERVLGAPDPIPAPDAEEGRIIRFPAIEEILAGNTLRSVFQPILRANGTRFGFEALTRAHGNWLTGGPSMLFDYAEKRSRLADLNVRTLTSSIVAATELPGAPAIFVNVDPLTFGARQLVPSLKAAAAAARLPLARLVLEVTERSAFANDEEARPVFEELRAEGARFALDDHGSAYSHLSVINSIRPSFIKVSQTFGTDFEQDPTKVRIVRHVLALARDFGCETILEGIESAQTARAAADMGVDLLQGYHFGYPTAASHWAETLRVA